MLEQRAALIKETIDSAEAEQQNAEAEETASEEYEAKLADARQEAAELVADAQNRAERGL